MVTEFLYLVVYFWIMKILLVVDCHIFGLPQIHKQSQIMKTGYHNKSENERKDRRWSKESDAAKLLKAALEKLQY